MTIVNRALPILAALALAGCPGPVRTVTVQVPIPVRCEVSVPPPPALPIDALPPTADLYEVGRALWASLKLLEAHAGRLDAALAACAK